MLEGFWGLAGSEETLRRSGKAKASLWFSYQLDYYRIHWVHSWITFSRSFLDCLKQSPQKAKEAADWLSRKCICEKIACTASLTFDISSGGVSGSWMQAF